jgi:hypothetical protein
MSSDQLLLKPFQDEYLFSTKKFPCLCAGVGTGKTYMLLLKIWQHCLDYPNSVALIVRKEYTDLRDSTLKDVRRYFGVVPDGNKEHKFPNGSVVMFRHGAEINVLKNMTLSIVGIEQAEEFDTDETFTFLRDRLRHPIGTCQLCIIANANGPNWVWKIWINNPPSDQYHMVTATTFDNMDNLRPDFIEDLRRMEKEAPNHYRQYVLNSFEEMGSDDYVFSLDELVESGKLGLTVKPGFGHKIAGFDIARFGEDKCSAYGIVQCDTFRWTEFLVDEWGKTSGTDTEGRIRHLSRAHHIDTKIIDEDGLGAMTSDYLNKEAKEAGLDPEFLGFRNTTFGFDANKFYGNRRTEAAFALKDLIFKRHISIRDDQTIQELMTLRYRFTNDGRRILISKDEMRRDGIRSPNRADAIIMAASVIKDVFKRQANVYRPTRQAQPTRETNLFKLAGVA